MINPIPMKELFKPYELHFMGVEDLLTSTGLTHEKILRIQLQEECSKSIDETCINSECSYNHVKRHESDLYKKLHDEIMMERKKS